MGMDMWLKRAGTNSICLQEFKEVPSSQTLHLSSKMTANFTQQSTCHNHKAVNAVNSHQNNLEATGICACACARHGCFVPHSVVDFQKGERYVKIKGTTDPLLILHKADQYGLFHLQCFGIPHRAHELCPDHLQCGLPVVY